MLARISGPGIRALVPDRPAELVGPDLEIGLYPSDIAIGGKRAIVARARAAIATRLTSTAASMTTSAEAQAIEAQLEQLSAARVSGAGPGTGRGEDLATEATTLSAIDDQLATLVIPHEEWEILYRQRLQVERDLLAGRDPGSVLPNTPGTPLLERTAAAAEGRAATRGVMRRRGTRAISTIVAAAGLLLAGADVLVALRDRRRQRG
jgi:hypothetical protein